MERRESWEGREGVEGLLGVAGGWVRWASDGRSGDDMALSLMRGLPEETLPGDCQYSSSAGDSEDAADVCESSLGGVLVDEGRLLPCCCDDRLDLSDAPTAKLTDDLLRAGTSSLPSISSRYVSYLSSSTKPIAFSSSSRSSASASSSFPALPPVIKYTPKNVNAQPPKNLPNRLALADWKSRYSTALPIITEIVKRTNCTGMTWVESNLCRARLTYRIWARADTTNMNTRR